MRIVLISHNSELEGASLHLLHLAMHFKNHGYTCTILLPGTGPLIHRLEEEAIDHRILSGYIHHQRDADFQHLLASLQPESVIVNTLLGHRLLHTIRQSSTHASLYWIIHESERETYERRLPQLHAKDFSVPDCVIFPSESIKEKYADLPMQQTAVIPNGVAYPGKPVQHPSYIKNDLGLPNDAVVISCIGTINALKGQHIFVESAIQLIHRHPNIPLYFLIAGRYTDLHAPYRDALIQRIQEEGFADRFLLYPPVLHPETFFRISSFFVCPSHIETFPYVVLEAMSYGIPLVASSTKGIREQIEDGVHGLLMIPGNSASLTGKLSYLLTHPVEAERMGRAGMERSRSEFSDKNMFERYADLLRSVHTTPKIQPTLRSMLCRALYSLWIQAGSPLPTLARYIRYRMLQRWWIPIDARQEDSNRIEAENHSASMHSSVPHTTQSVCIVITSHNYGIYLDDAIRSALHQTYPIADIIVVDDASTDNTAEVAQKYIDAHVHCIQGTWQNAGKARNAALALTDADFLVFLDADDMLHPQYVECSVSALMQAPEAGIAYPDHQFFGNSDFFFRTPEPFHWQVFDRQNHINTVAMVRRTALMQAGGWMETDHQHLDWLTWRSVLALGWQATKSRALHFHRKHDSNMFDSYVEQYPYAYRSGMTTLKTTLFLSLSGREWMWPKTQEFLENQTLPHHQIHLVILDTSQNPTFGLKVRTWLAQSDYASTTYQTLTIGRKGIADAPRETVQQEVRDACAALYNTCARLCQTTTACFLEDDILPPLDAYTRLLQHFDADAIGVSASIAHRQSQRPIAWNWSESGIPKDATPSTGIERIGGTGFGCLVLRGEYLRHSVFSSGLPLRNYDQNFFRKYTFEQQKYVLLDWDCKCKHYSSKDIWA